MKKNELTTVIIFFIISFSFAQEVEQDTLNEIILESTYNKTNSILPSVSITEETFENYSPVDIVSAINQTPGVYMLSGALNTNRLTIRGIGSRTPFATNKVRAYFNEIPITNGTGETTLEVYDPEMLQRIDIIKGPKATSYGSNLGGALLLKPTLSSQSTFLKNSFTVGSFNLIRNTLSGGYSNEKLSVTLNYNHLSTDGYRQNSHYNRNSTFLNFGYKFNTKNEVNFLFNNIDYVAHIPSSINNTTFNENPQEAAQNWLAAQGFEANNYTLLGLTYSHHNDHFKNSTTIFYSYLDHYEPRPFNILDEFTHNFGARSIFGSDFNLFGLKTNLTIGGEIYIDEYNWETIENTYRDNNGNGSAEGTLLSINKENRSQLNIFTTLALNLTTKFKAQLGLGLNHTIYNFIDNFNEGNSNTSADKSFDPILAPNLNLVYSFNDYSSIYGNISKGFSFPGLEETLTPDGVINPEIGPETGMNYEIGTNLHLLKNKMHLSLIGYIMSIKNLLVAQRIGEDQYIGRNAGKTSHKGIEISTSYDINLTSALLVSPFVNASFNFHKFVDFVDEDENFSGNELTGVPDKNINAGIRFVHNKGLFLTTTLQHIGEIPITDSNSLYSNSFTIVNTKLGYKTQFTEKLTFEINAGINNITDENYASSVLINAVGFGGSEPRYYYPGNPINYFSSLKVKYLF